MIALLQSKALISMNFVQNNYVFIHYVMLFPDQLRPVELLRLALRGHFNWLSAKC